MFSLESFRCTWFLPLFVDTYWCTQGLESHRNFLLAPLDARLGTHILSGARSPSSALSHPFFGWEGSPA